ncbi:unnamed protein product [Paramecium octaurelia]|uniref:Transmembrane protein n=1 Tax=Paramecium octaurelia TaxID=43137 RepID=A0A8S1YLY7_PAROT|nr:unnamed protein product [Paramecium octaurelia]
MLSHITFSKLNFILIFLLMQYQIIVSPFLANYRKSATAQQFIQAKCIISNLSISQSCYLNKSKGLIQIIRVVQKQFEQRSQFNKDQNQFQINYGF